MEYVRTRRLARFCADQYFGFEPHAWEQFAAATGPDVVAAAARYLSMTSWYGRDEELARIASGLAEATGAVGADTGAAADVRVRGFDLEYFSGVLRIDIATRRLGAARADMAHSSLARR